LCENLLRWDHPGIACQLLIRILPVMHVLELLLLEQLLLLHLLIPQLLLFFKEVSALEEPFRITFDIALGWVQSGIAETGIVLPYLQLLLVQYLVLFMHLAHLFDLV
jgi:hypothetical protein